MYGKTQKEHNEHLEAALIRISEAGLTLSQEKCEFNRTNVKFLGQLVDETGIKPDPDKIQV